MTKLVFKKCFRNKEPIVTGQKLFKGTAIGLEALYVIVHRVAQYPQGVTDLAVAEAILVKGNDLFLSP